MQVLLSTKCRYCDILLEGREQFLGHMIHGHEMSVGQAETMWKSVYSYVNDGGAD
ncbi:hypothetical protein NTE_03157 [Candidatus Nitrososphaera evergladensis SR1]|jgi:hypothetical protein|uniref:C2H2-type domain-containing protein n=1 Tax=Candidatus Nitrososphaera evergladensis SR1 TaxID=1459636 RepID=A0A075N134_9ARCH|nr:hypothetical protein [Candidatus Nitrososphaera evergladensis]AIF85189.1 hypothetical protein NTE_03157 [Candidatus Nitrososphaera evergladensis SR1]